MKSYETIVTAIIDINQQLQQFWSKAHGWAPQDAANLLELSRLDWIVSLSESLFNWSHLDDLRQGDLILAWANLGALIEGTLKFFLTVYLHDYQSDIALGKELENNTDSKKFFSQFTDKNGLVATADVMDLEKLIQYFTKKNILEIKQINFLKCVQKKRNAIHAYKNRDIGSFQEFHSSLSEYLDILSELAYRLPFPY